VTDRDADTRYLARLDAGTGQCSTVRRGGDFEIDGVSVHQRTGRLVYSRNVEGYTELSLAELSGPTDLRALPTPALPGGIAGGVSFDPSGDRVAATAAGRTANTNVHVVDVAASGDLNGEPTAGVPAIGAGIADGDASAWGGAVRWTRASTAGIPTDRFVEPELIRYESFDGLEIPALGR
jgi:dipeptidyl aminopeptidase/acylaminoacyl peptidase